MFKSYAGKKISQIMENMVGFVLVASGIYHCFFFLGPPLVMSDGAPVWPQAACWRLPGISCVWLTPSVVNLVTLHSAVRLKHHRTRSETLLRLGLFFPLRLLPLAGEWSAWVCWLLPYGEWLSTRIPASTISVLSPQSVSPVSPQAYLVHTAPHPLCRSPG